MNKPYIVCHMMTSVDGRIDCAMTEHLRRAGILRHASTRWTRPHVSAGRVTAELEMALPGKFEAKTAEAPPAGGLSRPPTPRATDRR